MDQPAPEPVTVATLAPDHVLFRDRFDRSDGARGLGDGWTDGAAFNGETFAPLGVRDGSLHCAAPFAPTGPEKGIGCCWRDLGTVDVEATIVVPPQTGHFREATPLLHVTPGSALHGFGAWLSTFHGKAHLGFLIVGFIGNPVEDFQAVATATYLRDDKPHAFTMRSQHGRVTCHYDGVPLDLVSHPDGEPIPHVVVPAELRDSSCHGVAVDCHLEPDEEHMTRPVVDDVWFASTR
jgi:hypothetical protein